MGISRLVLAYVGLGAQLCFASLQAVARTGQAESPRVSLRVEGVAEDALERSYSACKNACDDAAWHFSLWEAFTSPRSGRGALLLYVIARIVEAELGDDFLGWTSTAFERTSIASKRLGLDTMRGDCLTRAGVLHARMGSHARAFNSWEQALMLQQVAGSGEAAMQLHLRLSTAAGFLGEEAKLREHNALACALSSEMVRPFLESKALLDCAIMMERRGSARQALELAEACSERAARLSFLVHQVEAALVASECLGELGEAERSKDVLSRVLDRLVSAAAIPSVPLSADELARLSARLQGALGVACARLQRWSEAASLLEGVERQEDLHSSIRNKARINLGLSYLGLGRVEDARRLLRAAVEGAGEDLHQRAEASYDLGRVFYRDRDLQGLESCADLILRVACSSSVGGSSNRLLQRGYELRCLQLLERGHYSEAFAAAKLAVEHCQLEGIRLGVETEGRAREYRSELFRFGIEAAYKFGRLEHLFEMLESARAGALFDLLSIQQRPERSASTERSTLPLGKLDRDLGLEYLQVLERKRSGRWASGDEARWEKIRKDYQDSIEATAIDVEERRRRVLRSRVDLESAQRALHPSECLVLLGQTRTKVLALIVERSEARAVVLGEVSELERIANACSTIRAPERVRAQIPQPIPDIGDSVVSGGKALELLRARLLDPLALRSGIRRVVISPTSGFAHVPFASLDHGREYEFAPSASVYALKRIERWMQALAKLEPSRVLAFGDPQRDDGVEPIANAQAEAKAISHRRGDLVRLAGMATEAEFRSRASRGWRALHLACHGVANPRKALESALKLARGDGHDGDLTVGEVLEMKAPCDLVVLSACDTARGAAYEAEGVLAFPTAFFAAGATQVLVSLWPVNDEATKELMIKFYAEWNGPVPAQRVDAATALHRAQAFLRAQPKWSDPYYWAAWQLWGPSERKSLPK
ncbi:MAG: CHAT domain-containing protein [Planctomycetes bacterium]|nr:CHAT domain-containing protein [Planctomycetota bacterium]